MGNAKIWFYPNPPGDVVEIDLGEGLSDLQYREQVDQSVSEGITGKISQVSYSSRAMVRIVDERFTTAALARKLFLLRNHLQAGGLISVAEDADKAVAGFTSAFPPPAQNATVQLVARPWPYNGSATLASGDEIELLGSQPRSLRQFAAVDSLAAGDVLSTSENTHYDYEGQGARWLLVRHRGFWPALRLPKESRNEPVITHDHRISYTLDVELEEAIDVIESYAESPTQVSPTTESGTGPTLEEQNGAFRPSALNVNQPWWA